jgi:hypothetical protein
VEAFCNRDISTATVGFTSQSSLSS